VKKPVGRKTVNLRRRSLRVKGRGVVEEILTKKRKGRGKGVQKRGGGGKTKYVWGRKNYLNFWFQTVVKLGGKKGI